jgi:hypothetical protein
VLLIERGALALARIDIEPAGPDDDYSHADDELSGTDGGRPAQPRRSMSLDVGGHGAVDVVPRL